MERRCFTSTRKKEQNFLAKRASPGLTRPLVHAHRNWGAGRWRDLTKFISLPNGKAGLDLSFLEFLSRAYPSHWEHKSYPENMWKGASLCGKDIYRAHSSPGYFTKRFWDELMFRNSCMAQDRCWCLRTLDECVLIYFLRRELALGQNKLCCPTWDIKWLASFSWVHNSMFLSLPDLWTQGTVQSTLVSLCCLLTIRKKEIYLQDLFKNPSTEATGQEDQTSWSLWKFWELTET